MGTSRTRANNKYNKKAYDRLAVAVYKGQREEIKQHAESRGESLNGFINRAIRETVERDKAADQMEKTE